MEKKELSCEFNIDTACVEVKYADGTMIAIDCTRVENEVTRNMYEASELDWLIYIAPMDYVNLLLHGDIRDCVKNITGIITLARSCVTRCFPANYCISPYQISLFDYLLLQKNTKDRES